MYAKRFVQCDHTKQALHPSEPAHAPPPGTQPSDFVLDDSEDRKRPNAGHE